jgi:hypothetical protein
MKHGYSSTDCRPAADANKSPHLEEHDSQQSVFNPCNSVAQKNPPQINGLRYFQEASALAEFMN